MADGKEVLARVGKQVAPRFADAVFPVLVPNDKGLTRALEAGAKEVAVVRLFCARGAVAAAAQLQATRRGQ